MAGQPFAPSNGSEGMVFEHHFCGKCIHQNPNPDSNKHCEILLNNFFEGSTKEWKFSNEGWPVCTSWQKWDWGNDGDPDDPDNPKAPIKENPNQLLMPFDIWDLLGISDEIVVTKKAIIEREVLETL